MPEQIYCLKCRKFTNKDLWVEKIMEKGKERNLEKATCEECSKQKNRFIKLVEPELVS